MKKNHICIITGARSDYGYLKPVIEKISKSTKLKISLIVTGIHLLEEYGNTIEFIKKDNFTIAKIVYMYDPTEKSELSLGKAVGKAIINFTKCFYELNPDIILVLGDRFEALAAVIAASTLSKVIAHIHGGDNVSQGQIDEQIRHSITKFAHIHFPTTPKSAQRIKLMGEEEWRIHMVGSPGIDMIYEEKLLSKREICKKFNFDIEKKIVLCVQHPYINEYDKAGDQMRTILQVLKDLNFQAIIIYPNNDRGNELIIKEIEVNKSFKNFRIYRNLERIVYLSLLKFIDVLVGNTSSGLIESSVFNLPVVNIGDRNKGRESAENVINVPPNYTDVKKAINRAISLEFKKICQNVKNPYGDGKASMRIVKILEDLEKNKKLLIKKLTYNV